MSKLLANQIANYNDNGPVEAKEGLNIAQNKPLELGGSAGNAGQYLVSNGSYPIWQDLPTIPDAQVQGQAEAVVISDRPARPPSPDNQPQSQD